MGWAVVVSVALAVSGSPCRSGALGQEALDRRIAVASSLVESTRGDLELWFASVFGVHAAVMVAALVIANEVEDDGFEKELYFAAFGSGLGILTLQTGRPPVIDSAYHLAGAQTKAERLAVLEFLLEKSAKKVRFAQSWIAHTASFLYSVGASLFLWFALDRKRAAITQLIGGQLIGQGRILIQPTNVSRAWDEYRGEFLPGCGDPAPRDEAAALTVEPAGLGVQLRW